jgi:hypothetical protein
MTIDKSDKNDTNNIIKKEYDNIQKRLRKISKVILFRYYLIEFVFV